MSGTPLSALVEASGRVAATRARTGKLEILAECIAAVPILEVPTVVAYLVGELPQGSIGVGYAALRELGPAARRSSLVVADVDATFAEIAAVAGPGSKARRADLLSRLMQLATDAEQEFLRGLLTGALRQGALEGVMTDAIAVAARVPQDAVRRAAMYSGNLPEVAAAALANGADALAGFGLELFRPVAPMLAQTAESVGDAVGRLGRAVVDWKLDGARVQVHRRGDRVAVFTRNLRDVTEHHPDVAAAVAAMPADELVLDGEVIAVDGGGRPRPFQETMRRFGTETVAVAPLRPFFFDILQHDGRDLTGLTLEQRLEILDAVVDASARIPRLSTDDGRAGETFFAEAIAAGHEGVVVKAAEAPYEAGRRGGAWLKVKPVHTLDLVVLAAEWGSGRRRGTLSNIHLGARHGAGFVMLGKTFKGMTDDMLRWQTERFLELETHREGHVVFVRPEQVVEIAFDGVQRSTRYPGGVALRFARVKAYRDDKASGEADTLDAVRAFLAGPPVIDPGGACGEPDAGDL